MLRGYRSAWFFAVAFVAGMTVFTSRVSRAFFQDTPLLSQILATEISSYAELGAILAKTAKMVGQVTEHVELARAAYGAVDTVRNLSWSELEPGLKRGVGRAFPEARDIYGYARRLKELDEVRPQSIRTLRGMLWKNVYGPGIDALHDGHERLEQHARTLDVIARHEGKNEAIRKNLRQLEEACEIGGLTKKGGKCLAAAQRAEIQQSLILADIHEAQIAQLNVDRRRLQLEDQAAILRHHTAAKVRFDTAEFLRGVADRCIPGSCLYQKYAGGAREVQTRFEGRHP